MYAASVELPTLWARAASATAHGVDVCSITQSRKLERNPCGTAGMPSLRSSAMNVVGTPPCRCGWRGRPCPARRRSVTPPSVSPEPSGQRHPVGTSGLHRAAGTSQVAASQSISLHSAARTSTERPAVSTRNSKASLVGMSAVDSLTRATAPGTWA